MKVLVTGATGRVGANLIKRLSEKGYGIRALVLPGDKTVEKLKPFNVEIFEGDFVKYEDCAKAVEGVDAIFHIGAYFPQVLDVLTRKRSPHEIDMACFEVNVRGTFNMLEATHKNCPRCKRFVFASSDIVYSPHIYDPADEDHPIGELHPKGSTFPPGAHMYKVSKVMGEDMVTAYQRQFGLPTVRCRFAFVIGAGEILEREHMSIGWWLSPMLSSLKLQPAKNEEVLQRIRILEKEAAAGTKMVLPITKDGKTTTRPMADVRDIVQGLLLSLEKESAVGEAFNFAAPSPLNFGEAVPYASKVFGTPYVKLVVPEEEVRYSTNSVAKARAMIGYDPKYDIFKMIDDAAAFQRGEDVGVVERLSPKIL